MTWSDLWIKRNNMETQDISKNPGIAKRLNLSETPTGSKQKAEWSFGSSEQPLK
jgi:hypothetical protein